MRSNRQIEASRANGSKSRGPVTQEGKRASSRNAIKHGVLSECIVLPGERADSFQSLTADLFEEHRPVGSTEEDLVEMMAVSRWRRMRIWTLEKTCLSNRMLAEYRDAPEPPPAIEDIAGLAFASLANETRTLDLVSRYESRYDRQYFRAHRRLLELQDRRMRNEPDNPPVPISGPATPGPRAGNSDSAKRTQASEEANEENVANTEPPAPAARLSHWHSAFTPFENIANSLQRLPLRSESPEKATVFAALSGIEQS